MNTDDKTLEWIEAFYLAAEKGLDNYVRPDDYLERAIRVLTRAPKTMRNQYEGKTGYMREEN